MEPSHRQQAALEAWTTTDSNILMNAVAGSGKSTTLMLLLESCKHTVLFLAFNKSIKEETEAKLIKKNLGQGKAMTMHGLGLAAIRGAYKFRINNNKNWDIIRKIQTQYKAQFKRIPYAEQGGVSYSLVDMNEVSRMYLTDDIPTIREHMKSMDKTLSNHPKLEDMWEIFLKLRAESYEGNHIEIDFADMIYLPILKDLTIPIYPYYLMVD